jgi:hypothetical protein
MNSYEQRQADKKERLENAAAKRQEAGEAQLASAREGFHAIPFGQPVHGARDRNYREKLNSRMGSGIKKLEEAEALEARADAVGTGGIASDDPEAVVKLKAQLAAIVGRVEAMKAMNKDFRKRGMEAVPEHLRESVALTMKQRPWMKGPYEAYEMSNEGANRRRIEKRIAALTRHTETAELDLRGIDWRLTEDRDEGRFLLDFHGVRVSAELYKLIRSYGFLWARSVSKFVRKITPNAVGSARMLAARLGTIPNESDDTVEADAKTA